MPNVGAIYGTVKYGDAYYGSPIGVTAGLPIYSSEPFSANTQGYRKVVLSWNPPTAGETLYLVRNGQGDPTDQNDGVVLLVQPIGGLGLYVDTTIESTAKGQILYYALWNQDGAGDWWWSGSTQAMVPGTWGYGTRMFSLVPQWYQDQDNNLAGID